MTLCRSLPFLILSAAASVVAMSADGSAAQPPVAQIAAPASEESKIVEMRAYRSSGVVSAWLSNGICVHHRRMTAPAGQIEVMISFAGGELLECPDTRGLSLLSASFLDHPAAQGLPENELKVRFRERDVRIAGDVMPDALLLRISGSAADIGIGLETAAATLSAPRVTPELLDSARASACASVDRTHADSRWSVTEPLLNLLTPVGECRNKLACTKKMSSLSAEQVENWITRHAKSCPCEIAIVGDVDMREAFRLVIAAFGSFPDRSRSAPAVLADQRCIVGQQGPFVRDVGCRGNAGLENAHVLAGFLSPDPSEIQEVRRLRAGARVLSLRLENRLRELKLGGNPHVSWQYLPSSFAGRSVTVVSASVAPGDAEPVKQVMQASMCELMEHGLPADELQQSTELLARVAATYEREPHYWASILARSASNGLDPEMIAGGAESYRAMKTDDVLAAMRRACTVENRLDLVVRPAPHDPPVELSPVLPRPK